MIIFRPARRFLLSCAVAIQYNFIYSKLVNRMVARQRGGKMLGNVIRQARKTFVAMPSGAKTGVVAATTLLALATASLVYATGGVQFAYLHLMYIPVVLSGLAFGVRGGVLAGIAGGLLLGPFMPLNTSTGAMQQPVNWIYRLTSFALIGTLVGAGAQLLRRQLRELEWLHEHHPDTGLLNLAGLLKELDEMICKRDRQARVSSLHHAAE